MSKFATIADALDSLPHGPEAIADHLAGLGVRGSCNDPGQCAIAEYLTATVDIPDGWTVKVSNNAAGIRRPGGLTRAPLELCWFQPAGVTQMSVDRPDVQEFIRNFDRGQYPALVDSLPLPVAA